MGSLVAVDDLLPVSTNLAIGVNELGYHLINTNCGRDYTSDLILDIALGTRDSICTSCGTPLEKDNAFLLKRMCTRISKLYYGIG